MTSKKEREHFVRELKKCNLALGFDEEKLGNTYNILTKMEKLAEKTHSKIRDIIDGDLEEVYYSPLAKTHWGYFLIMLLKFQWEEDHTGRDVYFRTEDNVKWFKDIIKSASMQSSKEYRKMLKRNEKLCSKFDDVINKKESEKK